MSTPLHPNLARLAATYDEIFTRWTRGQIDAAIARQEIAALVARDDDGILWSIDPESGGWLRRTITGELVPGTPPSYGLATPTPHDLSQQRGAFNPDEVIRLQPVEDELLYAPSTLAGSTRRPRVDPTPTRNASWWKIALVIAGVIAAVIFVAGRLDDGSAPDVPVPTTQAPTTP